MGPAHRDGHEDGTDDHRPDRHERDQHGQQQRHSLSVLPGVDGRLAPVDGAVKFGGGARSTSELAADADVRAAIDAGIEAASEKLSRVEEIRKFTILPEIWEPGSPRLAPELERKPIAAAYADAIEAMYRCATDQ
jgi:long-subunit acyl-CoA synthetase (AMP-forming)